MTVKFDIITRPDGRSFDTVLRDSGLVFAGANAFKMKEILSVREIFDRFVKAAESVYKENVPGIRAAEPVAS